MERTEVAAKQSQRSYSRHDAQECGAAGAHRDNLMTALLVWNFVFTLLNVLRGLVPAVTLFSSFIYGFGCFRRALFFYVFHRAQ
jgi:hypothetical protein